MRTPRVKIKMKTTPTTTTVMIVVIVAAMWPAFVCDLCLLFRFAADLALYLPMSYC